MGFLYIGLSVICSICIAHLLKLVRRKEIRIIPVLTVNYAVAATISYFQSETSIQIVESSQIPILFAAGAGVLFIVNFFLYSYSLNKNGVGVSVAAMRLSLVLPVLVSLLIYNEILQFSNSLGVITVFIALILLIPRTKGEQKPSISWSLALLFLFNGFVDVLMKIYDREFSSILDEELFLFFIFSSAFLVGLMYLAFQKKLLFKKKELLYGSMVGIVNLYSSFFLLLALQELSGALVFSATNMLNVLLGTLLGVFYWKDQLTRNQFWGLGLAVIAIILLIL